MDFPMRVAMTGGTGFLGLHVARLLRQRGCTVRAVVRPTSECKYLQAIGVDCQRAALDSAAELARVFNGCDTVFHLAGAVGFAGDWNHYHRVNVEGTGKVLEAARTAGVRRLVHTSSIVGIGASWTPVSLDESVPWKLARLRIPYFTTKWQAEQLALQANDNNLETVIVNPASVVGPDDFGSSEFGTLCKRFWRGRLPVYFGGGNNFVDVRDVAEGHLLAATKGRPGARYILGGVNRSYRAFFLDLCRVAGRFVPRLRMPNFSAPWICFLHNHFSESARKAPLLSAEQAAIIGLFFYFDDRRARAELGYHTRSWHETLADTHAFWMKALRKAPAASRAA